MPALVDLGRLHRAALLAANFSSTSRLLPHLDDCGHLEEVGRRDILYEHVAVVHEGDEHGLHGYQVIVRHVERPVVAGVTALIAPLV